MRSAQALLLVIGLTAVRPAPARAQLLPSPPTWPTSPTEPQQCADFAAELDKYQAEVSRQHQDCLHAGKEDMPNQPADSLICSRSACQILHDILFSQAMYTDVKVLRQKVESCYSEVREHQERRGREKRESSEENGDTPLPDQGKDTPPRAASPSAPTQFSAVINSSPVPAQPYTVGSMQNQETKEQQQARLEVEQREKDEQANQLVNQLADPFGKSNGDGPSKSAPNASSDLADPFGDANGGTSTSDSSASSLPDPFSAENSERRKAISDPGIADEEAKDIVIDTIKNRLHHASVRLQADLDAARSRLSPVNLAQYESEVGIVTNFLDGVRHTITTVGYAQDLNAWIRDPRNGWGPIEHDIETGGFSYLLKRLAPPLSKVYEGPVGWVASITLDSSSTQTPAQDFDPMTVLNSPAQYSFDKRVDALQQIYVSVGKHPEVWNESKCKWLYQLTLQVYNSPDNPNFHLVPVDDSDIHLSPK
jgi:hypothetical protein